MSMTDPIADLLTRIRNGQKARKVSVTMPASRVKRAVAKVLHDEGYITGVTESQDEGKPLLTVELKYHNGTPVIASLHRVSRPGLRVYKPTDELPKVLNGLGVAIISTSEGVMSDREARRRGQGGEVICTVS
jgi:small subunit ribosomal protein S8